MSAVDDLNLDDLRSVATVLSRIPGGRETGNLVWRLGLMYKDTRNDTRPTRERFPATFSELSPNQLSDLAARVTSELGTITELCGLLNGLAMKLKVQGKAARAQARSTLRRQWIQENKDKDKPAKAPTKAELDDEAEDDPSVRTIDEQLMLVELILTSAQAARDASILYKETVSREITWRSEQLKARI